MPRPTDFKYPLTDLSPDEKAITDNMVQQVVDDIKKPSNQITSMELAAIGQSYLNLRRRYRQIENSLYEVTLTVVNFPCGEEGERVYEITREAIDKRMQELVNKHIGEIDHNAVKFAMANASSYSMARLRLGTVSVPDSVGILNSYSIDVIRDGSGSLIINGHVWLSPRAEEMIRTDNYLFAMRSSIIKPDPNKSGCRLDMIHAFDLLLASDNRFC